MKMKSSGGVCFLSFLLLALLAPTSNASAGTTRNDKEKTYIRRVQSSEVRDYVKMMFMEQPVWLKAV